MNIHDELSERFLSSLSPQQAELLLRDLDLSARPTSMEALHSYLQAQGWQQGAHPSVFQKKPDGAKLPYALSLPPAQEYFSSEEHMTRTVKTIVRVEHLSPFRVLHLARQQPEQKVPSETRAWLTEQLARHQVVPLRIHLARGVAWDEHLSRQLQEAGCESTLTLQPGWRSWLRAMISSHEQLQRLLIHPDVASIEPLQTSDVAQSEASGQQEPASGKASRSRRDHYYQEVLSHLREIEERLLKEKLREKLHYEDALSHVRMIGVALEGIKQTWEAFEKDDQTPPQPTSQIIATYQQELQNHKDWLTLRGLAVTLPDGDVIMQNLTKQADDRE
jgi:hypothetical protein